jgi:hypothetical protein
MTLSFSRHNCVEFVFDQEVDTWLRCHRHPFEWYGGVVRRVVLDNLKAAIVHAPFTIRWSNAPTANAPSITASSLPRVDRGRLRTKGKWSKAASTT